MPLRAFRIDFNGSFGNFLVQTIKRLKKAHRAFGK